jgi:hypothetical protein
VTRCSSHLWQEDEVSNLEALTVSDAPTIFTALTMQQTVAKSAASIAANGGTLYLTGAFDTER